MWKRKQIALFLTQMGKTHTHKHAANCCGIFVASTQSPAVSRHTLSLLPLPPPFLPTNLSPWATPYLSYLSLSFPHLLLSNLIFLLPLLTTCNNQQTLICGFLSFNSMKPKVTPNCMCIYLYTHST